MTWISSLPAVRLKIGRQAANALGGAYYPLDEERDTARVILPQPDGSRLALDFAGTARSRPGKRLTGA